MKALLAQQEQLARKRKAVSALQSRCVPYFRPHESYTAEVLFPGEFLLDIQGSLLTDLRTCTRSSSWLRKGEEERIATLQRTAIVVNLPPVQ
jgi:hypothetical protein